MSLANPCWLVNKACVSASTRLSAGCQSVVEGLKQSLWSWTPCSSCQSVSSSGFCVCHPVCVRMLRLHGRTRDAERSRAERREWGGALPTFPPDWGIGRSGFTSVCRVLMNAGVSRCDKIAAWLGHHCKAGRRRCVWAEAEEKLYRHFTLMNLSYLPDNVLTKMFLTRWGNLFS